MDKKQKYIRRAKVILALLFVLTIIAGAFLIFNRFFRHPEIPSGPERIEAVNAGWMRHNWFSTEKTDAEIGEMVKSLRDMNISVLYIHTGPLDSKGRIPTPDKNAWLSNRKRLLAKMPHIKFEAWLGGVNEISYGKADDTLNLGNKDLLETITKRAGEMTDDYLFDGIHYDIEPVPDNDTGFLLLLDLTREKIGSKNLSISTPRILESEVIRKYASGIGGTQFYPWSCDYFRKAAEKCDDIVIMSYDSGEPTEAAYTNFMADQLTQALNKLKGLKCRLLMGVPSYEDKTISHNTKSENVKSGINGVVLGLSRVSEKNLIKNNFKGIAVYAIWTTDQNEIGTIKEKWGSLKVNKP